MPSAESATILALRLDVAHLIARRTRLLGTKQLAAARTLGVPQPTLSKIMNGRVSDLSLELLIRIAVRAGLPMALQTGLVPDEAGAFVSGIAGREKRAHHSASSDSARETLVRSERALSPAQRLDAFLEHNQIIAELHAAGRRAEAARVRPEKRR